MIKINDLEIHASNVCNLSCESCAHLSNNKHLGMLSIKEADDWIGNWKNKIEPINFCILGGEPTLNPNLCEIIKISQNHWKNTNIILKTNGFFLHNHPELKDLKIDLQLTIHHSGPEYLSKVEKIKELLRIWGTSYKTEVSIYNWTRRYNGFGENILPFNDNDGNKSWKNCKCRNCFQLFRERIYKCPPITYLNLQKEKYPNISSEWDQYLKYQGINYDCTDKELKDFLKRKYEFICRMCPVVPEKFLKPSPL